MKWIKNQNFRPSGLQFLRGEVLALPDLPEGISEVKTRFNMFERIFPSVLPSVV